METENIKLKNLAAAVKGRAEKLNKIFINHPQEIEQAAPVTGCLDHGYAPRGYGLADFSIIYREGWFHLFHIPRVPGNSPIHPANEHWIGHAKSNDFDTWITCDPVLWNDPKHPFESSHVWAPFIYEESGTTYMFYTGLSSEPSQVLCMALSCSGDLSVWGKYKGNPITPLDGFDWHWKNHLGHARHARDPHLVKIGDQYLLVYTAMHESVCPAVGGLISSDLLHWRDIGPILYGPMKPAIWLPESVNIQPLPGNKWVLIPSQSPGLVYYISDDPFRWHGIKPIQIEYSDGDNMEPVAVEVISRNLEDKWLVTFFELNNNRLFLGEINLANHPWTLTRIREPSALACRSH